MILSPIPSSVERRLHHPVTERAYQPVWLESSQNVPRHQQELTKGCQVLTEMIDNKEINISGAMYDVETGKVAFL